MSPIERVNFIYKILGRIEKLIIDARLCASYVLYREIIHEEFVLRFMLNYNWED